MSYLIRRTLFVFVLNLILMYGRQTKLFAATIGLAGSNLGFYFCYGDHFLPLISCFSQKIARSVHIKRLPFSLHLCQIRMFDKLFFVSVTAESITLRDMTKNLHAAMFFLNMIRMFKYFLRCF